MKKNRPKRDKTRAHHRKVYLSNRIPLIQRIIILLRHNINIAVIGVILTGGGVYLAYMEWIRVRKSQDTNITVAIGGVEIENGAMLNVHYMLPPDEYEDQDAGIIPISLINKNEYDAENFKIWIETNPFEVRKKVLELNASGKFVEREKSTVRGNRFLEPDDFPDSWVNGDKVTRECYIFKDIMKERVEYNIMNFNSLSVYQFKEKFKIDKNNYSDLPPNALCKDMFIVDLVGTYKNNKDIYESRLYMHVCKIQSIDKLVDFCSKTGFWGPAFNYDHYLHPDILNCILIYPNYYLDNDVLYIDTENTKVFSVIYKFGTFFRKRQVVIKDMNGNIIRKQKFYDSKETKRNLKKVFYGRKNSEE